MYAKRIDTARKVVAVSFTVCGLGFAAAANIEHGGAAAVLGIGTLASLIAAFGLFVEYLVRARLKARRGRAAAYQFTLAELMVVMAAVAVVLGVFRILGWCTIGLLIVVVLLLACGVEMVQARRPRDPCRSTSQNVLMAKVESTFETLDESIDHSARHDPWFKASKAIVGVGSLLAIAAMTVYRREFRPKDPIVGLLLGPFTVLYLAAWMHVFYTMVKIRLSKATRILCVIFGIAMVIFLIILLVMKPVLESIKN